MGSRIQKTELIKSVMGFDFSIKLTDVRGNIVPSGIARTIMPAANSVVMQGHTNLAALEFFTNYNEELVKKIREHKISSGNWL
jgi:hypothetical protein